MEKRQGSPALTGSWITILHPRKPSAVTLFSMRGLLTFKLSEKHVPTLGDNQRLI